MSNPWERIEDLYHRALEYEESQRSAFLTDACAGDETLRREVESLLGYQNQSERLMESPAIEIAAKSLAKSDRRLLQGQQIGSYTILSLLGVGGMGEVYRARHSKLERDVALKVLPEQLSQDPER